MDDQRTATPEVVPSPASSPTPTQRRILDAAFQVWEQLPPSVLFGGFTVASVARAAGVTRATFYSYWPSIEDYFHDLLDHLATLDPDGYRPGVGPAVNHLSSSGVQITPDFYDACERQLVAVMQDPAFRVRLGFFSKMDDPGAAEKLRARYRVVEARTEELYRSVRESWAREIRPPLTPEQVHVVYTSIMEGLAARRIIDPEAVPLELYGKITLALTMVLTRRSDDPRTLDDVLDAANAWPAVGMRLRGGPTGGRQPSTGAPLDASVAQLVVRQARKLQASMGWHELTLADIANVTGVSEEALVRGFGSMAGLAMAIFMMNVHERYDALRPTGDPATDLRHMIAAGADELRRAPGLTHHVAQVIVGGSSLPIADLIDWNPIVLLIQQIRTAQDAGVMRPDVDATELALTLNRLMLTESQQPPRPIQTGPDMVELLLLGAGLTPATGGPGRQEYLPTAVVDELEPDAFFG